MDIILKIKEELNVEKWQVEAAVKLIDEGNTIPFIARYRKEMHGSMDDTVLRNLETRLQYLRNLQERKEEITRAIDSQGKLTEELALAMKTIAQHSFGITPDDLFIVTAREFGFKRTGENIIYSLRKVYQQMLKNGEVTEVDGKVQVLQ